MSDEPRARLAAARLYLCTDARRRQADLAAFLDAALGGGVDIVQLRHKGLEAGEELRYLEVFRAACDRHGALLAVNDRADVAYASGADVLHLGQDDLAPAVARQILGPVPVIGLSSHAEARDRRGGRRPVGGLLLHRAGLAHAHQARPPGTRPEPGQLRGRAGDGPAVVRDRRHRRGKDRPGAGGRRPAGGSGAGDHRGA